MATAARITMDQAIQIASSQLSGKVLECRLVRDKWETPEGAQPSDSQVAYDVVLLSGDTSKPVVSHVLVNAVDSSIIKTSRN